LSYSSGPDLVADLRDQAQPTGAVVDSVFRNFYFGFHAYEAQNIHVVGNEYRDSIVYAIDSHDRSKGLTVAYNTAYGTQLRHGITVSREVNDRHRGLRQQNRGECKFRRQCLHRQPSRHEERRAAEP
jgi:poly(beta-D-mannuronate) C5 epimerase